MPGRAIALAVLADPNVVVRREANSPWAERLQEKLGMARGKVKWFSDQKGYGFITPEDGSNDLFVHHSEIQGSGFKSLAEDDTVEFELGQGQKGPCATNVTKVD